MEQLRITTSLPGFFGLPGGDRLITESNTKVIPLTKQKAKGFFIHGDAEELAGYDIPMVLNGDLNNINLPVEEQDIMLVLPSGEYKCKCTIHQDLLHLAYYVTLFDENI